MTQIERRIYLIKELLREQPEYANMEIPSDNVGQKRLLRSLLNVRMPRTASKEFMQVQDAYLQEEIAGRGITRLEDLQPMQDNLYLWQGDITTLACDGIVNAANSQLLGCFHPCHSCIDNAIHTFSGIQLRLICADIMAKQGHSEQTGKAKITPAFNLPCRYVLHTVGPIVGDCLTEKDKELLASCYSSCLELAEDYGIQSIAFPCISTGEFHFPNDKAAQLAAFTVRKHIQQKHSKIKVIFNVFKDIDYKIYKKLLQCN